LIQSIPPADKESPCYKVSTADYFDSIFRLFLGSYPVDWFHSKTRFPPLWMQRRPFVDVPKSVWEMLSVSRFGCRRLVFNRVTFHRHYSVFWALFLSESPSFSSSIIFIPQFVYIFKIKEKIATKCVELFFIFTPVLYQTDQRTE
jgi:hypothetical protein